MSKYLDAFDYEQIHEQAAYVIKNRKKMKQSAVAKYIKHFEEKCAKSKAATLEAKKYIPGGIQHNLANNHPFALSAAKAEGPYLYDVDGNRYIDFLCAGGPTILGNNFPAVKEAAVNLINEAGPITGLYSDYELQFAKLVTKYYPTIDKIRLLGTGSEANVIAIRLARAFTGRKHIIRFYGAYHGWSDQLVYSYTDEEDVEGVRRGIPTSCYKNTHAVPINDIAALEAEMLKFDKDGGVAAFIMEAVGQDSGAVPTTRAYHIEAEKLCRKYGILLIYDEVVTGFRLGMGGAQAFFGTKPDITVFGKIIGGGYATAAAVGARNEIMDLLAAGVSDKSHSQVRVGGTLSANPLSALAGIATIQQLEKLDVHRQLDAAAAKFMRGVADITDRYDVPAILFNHQSILHVDIHGAQHLQYFYASNDSELAMQSKAAYTNIIELAMGLAAEGLIVANGGKTYLCYDTIGVIDDALHIYEKVLSQFE
jgi:glutamate-1-semialdehyde 2,1-aminomutase